MRKGTILLADPFLYPFTIWEWMKEKAEGLWEAIKNIVPGSALTGPVDCGPGMIQIWTNQPPKINYDPFDPKSPVPPTAG